VCVVVSISASLQLTIFLVIVFVIVAIYATKIIMISYLPTHLLDLMSSSLIEWSLAHENSVM
jgi:hypothetical protein